MAFRSLGFLWEENWKIEATTAFHKWAVWRGTVLHGNISSVQKEKRPNVVLLPPISLSNDPSCVALTSSKLWNGQIIPSKTWNDYKMYYSNNLINIKWKKSRFIKYEHKTKLSDELYNKSSWPLIYIHMIFPQNKTVSILKISFTSTHTSHFLN